MSEHEDKGLQKYLGGASAVSRRYRELEKPAPPAALDARILAAAREEARRPVRPAWMVPVALAATLVIGVGLSLQIQTSRDSMLAEAPSPAPVTASRSSADDERDSVESSADRALSNAASPPPTGQFDSGRLREEAVRNVPADVRDNMRKSMSEAGMDEESPSEFAPAPAAAALAPPPRRDDADLAIAADDAASGALARLADEQRVGGGAALAEAEQSGLAQVQAEELDAAPAGYRTATRTGAQRSLASATPLQPDPREQLRRIEATWNAGDEERARELFAEFRKQFPDYVIPESFPVEDLEGEGAKSPAATPPE